MIDKKINRAN